MRKDQIKETLIDCFWGACFGATLGVLTCLAMSVIHPMLDQPPQTKPIDKKHVIGLTHWTNSDAGLYVAPVPTHSELSLATQIVQGAQPPKAVFLCPSFGYMPSMASHGGIPSGMPVSLCIGSPTPHDLPPILANGCKLFTHKTQGNHHA